MAITLSVLATQNTGVPATAERDQRTSDLIQAAKADNTRLAYRAAIEHFLLWGGLLPCGSAAVVAYLVDHARSHGIRTLRLRVTAIGQWHRLLLLDDPTRAPEVATVLAGIANSEGKPKNKAKALIVEDLDAIVAMLREQGSRRALRDSALLQLGLYGAFRRSELVQLQIKDLSWEREGLRLQLSRSKTDQAKEGITKAIPYGDPARCCPVTALRAWLDAAGITSGPLFRRLWQGDTLGEEGLSVGSVNAIVATRAAEAQVIGRLTSHSLRRGLATSAHRAGADFLAIKKQGGWRADSTVREYIEEAEMFTSNAAGELLKRRI
jgi:integrase